MNDWEMKQIKNLGRVVTGKTPPTQNSEYFDGEELFVSPKDLDWDSYYITETETYITSKALEKFKNQVIPRNTVMFTSLSFAFGKIGIASRLCLTNQQINSVIVNRENNPKFVYYLLQAYKPIIFAYNSGIDTPIVPKSVFEKIEVKIPPKKLQEKIAAILSAYDELIENNQRRIALLEKMAEEIYREWFVRLRFPGHENAQFSKKIPSGWEICEIGSKFSTCLSGTPSRSEPSYWNGDIPWINSGEINKQRIIEASEFITENGLRYSATKIMPKKTTVIAITGATLGQVSLTEIEICANQSVVGVYDESGVYSEYIFQFVKANIENLIAKQSGGGQQHINKDIVEKEKILLPPASLIEQYGKTIRPVFDKISILLFSKQKLIRMRDLLLPRLISNKLSVEHLDIQFPPGMEEH